METSTVEERVERRDTDNDDIEADIRVYDAIVEYSYTYNSKQYTSDDIYPGSARSNEFGEAAGARDVLENYPECTTVTVYVDSREPEQSYLVGQSGTLGTPDSE